MNRSFIATAALWLSMTAFAQDVTTVDVNTRKPGAKIQPTMYGIFFEDINFGADGGLYAEMVKNRSFEYPQSLMGWQTMGNIEVRNDGPFERCPHYVRMHRASHPDRRTALINEGYFGITAQKDSTYRLSLWARCPEGGSSKLRIQMAHCEAEGIDPVISEQTISVSGTEWKQYHATLKALRTVKKAELRLQLMANEEGKIATTDVEHVSLFPTNTWKGRENGLRADIAQALADLHPGVFRFPGGCIVEGADLASRYQWKNSVGRVENRPINENRWNYTFGNRIFPDYFQSLGMGFYELFLLSEDIGAEPLPVVSCGMACQYQNDFENLCATKAEQLPAERYAAHSHILQPLDSLQTFIDDALDLIEFANGDVSTRWGAVRAEMGHPAPFNLKFLAVGNEQWDYKDNPLFTERLRLFSAAIRKAHPEIKLVGTVGPGVDDEKFNMLQPKMHEIGVDLYDEHYYRPDEWFLSNADRYDRYSRKGPKVFAGEYACHSRNEVGGNVNHFSAAIAEAAMMTGFERNADVVQMATYAPLLAHREGWQWRPDLIWFDQTQVVRTASYYVQQLFSENKATRVLPTTSAGKPLTGQEGIYATAAKDEKTGEVVVKIVNTNALATPPHEILLNLKGISKGDHDVTLHTFSLPSLADAHTPLQNLDGPVSNPGYADNSFNAPELLKPATTTTSFSGQQLSFQVPSQSLTIYRIK